MKSAKYIVVLFVLTVLNLQAKDLKNKSDLVMHEWGTFTTEIKYGSNGKQLFGLEKEEEFLPIFVYQHAWNSTRFSKGIGTPVINVSVKMETPVIYFYTEKETSFTVDVHFNGGKISQWYPQKSAGDHFDPKKIRLLDFNNLKEKGHIQWKGTILAKNSKEKVTHPSIGHNTWIQPRKTDSNLIKVNDEIEKYLFYRGLGNFETPFCVYFKNDKMVMENKNSQDIPYVLIYQKESTGNNAKILWQGSINKKQSKIYDFNNNNKTTSFDKSKFIKALIKSGLYKNEAEAMLNTWNSSYFKKKGLRIFWILPENLTNKILPLKISPTPAESKRVLVGRINIVK